MLRDFYLSAALVLAFSGGMSCTSEDADDSELGETAEHRDKDAGTDTAGSGGSRAEEDGAGGEGLTSPTPDASIGGSNDGSKGGAAQAGSSTGGASTIDTDDESGGEGGSVFEIGADDDVFDADECDTVSAPAPLQAAGLAIVFDVSASMGSRLAEDHDPELKWQPVVTALKTYLNRPLSQAHLATLTFFPSEHAPLSGGGGGGNPLDQLECAAETYRVPDVAPYLPPSPYFVDALDEVSPPSVDDWRMGTPTLAALEGTYAYAEDTMAQDPNSFWSVVLITDGVPALCDAQADSLDTVARAAAERAGVVPTYVIGIQGPTPETAEDVLALEPVAEAGDTGFGLFSVETGNPDDTTNQLVAALGEIGGDILRCQLALPEPTEGNTFDPDAVNFQAVDRQNMPVLLDYDPDCAGPNSWRFDDEANPQSVHLCPSTCTAFYEYDLFEFELHYGCARREIP